MGQEIDLLVNYPKTKRDPDARVAEKTEEDRAIARQFGKDFFDGDRSHGYPDLAVRFVGGGEAEYGVFRFELGMYRVIEESASSDVFASESTPSPTSAP